MTLPDRPVPLRVVRPDDPVVEPPPAHDLDSAFRQYSSYVAAVSLRLLGRDDEVDDVVQQVFLAAMKGIGALRDPRALKGWLATITVRVVRRRLRARRVRAWLRMDDAPEYAEAAAPGATPEERATLARVYEALDAIPVDERVAWTLRHVEGEKLESVAELCGCSLATAKRRIASAHAMLKERIGDG